MFSQTHCLRDAAALQSTVRQVNGPLSFAANAASLQRAGAPLQRRESNSLCPLYPVQGMGQTFVWRTKDSDLGIKL